MNHYCVIAIVQVALDIQTDILSSNHSEAGGVSREVNHKLQLTAGAKGKVIWKGAKGKVRIGMG